MPLCLQQNLGFNQATVYVYRARTKHGQLLTLTCLQCLSREVLKDYSVLLLDERPPRPRALLLADSNSQPEEINLLEYLEAKGSSLYFRRLFYDPSSLTMFCTDLTAV